MLIYALGGGYGHLTRSVALARAAGGARVLSNSPFVDRIAEPGVEVLPIDPGLDRDATARVVDDLLHRTCYDTLVVDTFPRGLGGELVGHLERMACRKVLVHRDLSPRYVADRHLAAMLRHYDVVFAPGERGPLAHGAIDTAPWLVRDRSELMSRDEALSALGVSGTRPVVLVMPSGTPAEADEMATIAARLEQQGDAHIVLARRWPMLELMAGIDVVVGAGGYNTVNEARATRRPLVALCRERRYDRQRRRLRQHEIAGDADDVVQRLTAKPDFAPDIPAYHNGVHRALAALRYH